MILTATQLRAWDEYTIRHEPISSIDLMERAARQCTEWMINHNHFESGVKIFCGKGNNGGDGLAIARQLLERHVPVTVYILEFGHKGSDDFQVNLQRLHRITTEIHFIQSEDTFPAIQTTDIVVDALFGSGLNRSLDGLSAALVEHINASGAKVISIDLPSGMFIDQSSLQSPVIKATNTLTFQVMKLCLLVQENAELFGEVSVLNIGLHPEYADQIETTFSINDVKQLGFIYRPRHAFAHKGHFGHALITGGSIGKAGAVIIATESCLRAGAGLTSVHLLSDDYTAINTRCPEAMTVSGDEMVRKNLSRFTAVGIGPGMGTGEMAQHLVRMFLSEFHGKLVMDADALNVLAATPALLNELPEGSVLTPHPKEFDRVFGGHTDDFSRINTALKQSTERRCVIVLKSHYTLIAYLGKACFNITGNAGLAKGGAGDALTGVITALLAQGYQAFEAARLGVWLHGVAADLALEFESAESLVATDLNDFLGAAFKKLSNVSD